MAQTIADITITNTWQSLNTASGLVVGTAMIIQNKSTNWVVLAEGSQPSVNDLDGVYITSLSHLEASKIAKAGSLEIWARTVENGDEAKLSVQEG